MLSGMLPLLHFPRRNRDTPTFSKNQIPDQPTTNRGSKQTKENGSQLRFQIPNRFQFASNFESAFAGVIYFTICLLIKIHLEFAVELQQFR